MKGQFDLFESGEAFARNTDPDTAHQAAQSMRGAEATRLEGIVLSVLKRAPDGLTNDEIIIKTGLSWRSATPRIAPLVRKGLVMDSCQRRIALSGRKQIVWKAI